MGNVVQEAKGEESLNLNLGDDVCCAEDDKRLIHIWGSETMFACSECVYV